MTINEVLMCILLPTLLVLSKLFELWIDIVGKKHALIKEKFLSRANQRKVKRTSVTELTLKQAQRLPQPLRVAFVSMDILYIILFLIILGFQLFAIPDNITCEKKITSEIWDGCKVRVPFCDAPFTPKCNCAVLQLTNYSMETLPEYFTQLNGLSKIEIIYGNLKSLHPDFGINHPRMKHFDLRENKLQSLPRSLFEVPPNLFRVHIAGNQLVDFPTSVSKASELWLLDAAYNNLTKFPFSSNMPQLQIIDFSHNSISKIPGDLSILPIVSFLDLFQNNIEVIPKSLNMIDDEEKVWCCWLICTRISLAAKQAAYGKELSINTDEDMGSENRCDEQVLIGGTSSQARGWVAIKDILCKDARSIVFFLDVTVLGMGTSLVEGLVFVFFVNDLNASNSLCGISVLITVLFEIPIFYYSDHVVDYFSNRTLMGIAHVAYVVRVVGYTVIPNPWWLLMLEVSTKKKETFSSNFNAKD
eukprot:g1311.t1